jgi:hypothetical protein
MVTGDLMTLNDNNCRITDLAMDTLVSSGAKSGRLPIVSTS